MKFEDMNSEDKVDALNFAVKYRLAEQKIVGSRKYRKYVNTFRAISIFAALAIAAITALVVHVAFSTVSILGQIAIGVVAFFSSWLIASRFANKFMSDSIVYHANKNANESTMQDLLR
jgi:FlaA1/EpsC-like NDP-sugar epimerase